jgi:hypothetical protein
MLVPAYYLFGFGFVSYGFLFFSVFCGFWLSVLAPRRIGFIASALGAGLLVYVLLGLFVGWMTFREEIRDVIWHGGGFGATLAVLTRAMGQMQLFSVLNFDSLDWINTRLNMPLFIGKMMEWHGVHPELQSHGGTLITLPLALVPRFLWPGKPERGGADFMAQHTGLVFSDDASFGTGSIFEFYVNFGLPGVFFGLLFIGWLLRLIDRNAAQALRKGAYLNFVRWMVVGVVFVDPLLRPFFIVSGAAIAWILMTGLMLVLRRHLARRAVAAAVQDASRIGPRLPKLHP